MTDEQRVHAHLERCKAMTQSLMASSWDGDIPSDEAIAESGRHEIESLLALVSEVRAAERERCAALLGEEAVRLLGSADREHVGGIARAANLLRESRPATQRVGEGSDAKR